MRGYDPNYWEPDGALGQTPGLRTGRAPAPQQQQSQGGGGLNQQQPQGGGALNQQQPRNVQGV